MIQICREQVTTRIRLGRGCKEEIALQPTPIQGCPSLKQPLPTRLESSRPGCEEFESINTTARYFGAACECGVWDLLNSMQIIDSREDTRGVRQLLKGRPQETVGELLFRACKIKTQKSGDWMSL
jgi:hypothetical protein